eukprot:CAMPEP_0113953934 /NCGR_PEP_ID=MMETSP0011_2-20120614/137_1 /TAXON_ID=101924 /ORGANISM="Rhodosorus marinus" /LENGTH=40 /DNA_ID=CAMNT_0000962735 /DNA_START=745 /DNA_END=867 /DNA_ORIENTATION=- /assembly_acc=CAM_ASM_000156
MENLENAGVAFTGEQKTKLLRLDNQPHQASDDLDLGKPAI